MVLQAADKDRMRTLLSEAIPMMCRSGLQFETNFQIEALIGITLDQDVFLVNIKETIKSDREDENEEAAEADTNSNSVDESSAGPTSPTRTKRKRKRSKDSAGKKSRQDTGDQSASDSDNETAPSPASNRLETQPVLSLEETSMDTALELHQTIANTTQKQAKVKQEKLESDSDSDDLVVVKEEHASFNYSNNADTVGGAGGSVFPGISNPLSQASVSSSFGLPQFQSANLGSQDLHAGPSLDMSAAQLLPHQQQDPQQVFALHPLAVAPPPTSSPSSSSCGDGAHCPICHVFIRQRRNLKEHIACKHSNQQHTCPVCGTSFKWYRTLRTHLRNAHTAPQAEVTALAPTAGQRQQRK